MSIKQIYFSATGKKHKSKGSSTKIACTKDLEELIRNYDTEAILKN